MSQVLAPEDLSKTKFEEFVQLMRGVGYETTDLKALKKLHDAVRDMANGPSWEGNVVAIGADGPPGVGKSFLARCVSRLIGAELRIYNCHPDASQEELVLQINPGGPAELMAHKLASSLKDAIVEAAKTEDPSKLSDVKDQAKEHLPEDPDTDPDEGMEDVRKLYNFGVVLEAFLMSQKEPTVLLIDEVDKGRYAVDATLLTALQEGELYVQGLGENGGVGVIRANRRNLLMFLSKNDVRDLEPALYRRLYFVNIGYPPKYVEIDMLARHTGVGKAAATTLVNWARKIRNFQSVEKEPSFPELKRLAMNLRHTAETDCYVSSERETSPDGHTIIKKGVVYCWVPSSTLHDMVYSGLVPQADEQKIVLKEKLIGEGPGTKLLKLVWDELNPEKVVGYKLRTMPENNLRKR